MRTRIVSIAPLVLSLAAMAQTAPSKPAAKPAPASSASAQPAPPANPLTDTQARELMELTGTDKIKEQLVANATTYFRRAFPPYIPKDVIEDITSSLQKADMNTPVVGIYKKYLSTEDATQAIAFYKTPAGKDLIKATPQIFGEAQRSAQQTAQGIVQAAMERHKTEIEAAQKSYQQEHQAPGAGSGPTLGPPAPGSSSPSAAPKSTTPQK